MLLFSRLFLLFLFLIPGPLRARENTDLPAILQDAAVFHPDKDLPLPVPLRNDTIVYTLQQFEKQFLDSNLQLLAQKYNITENEAYIRQAKIWDQPVMNFEHVLWNQERKTFFEMSDSSEMTAQIDQLIMIGGKRSKLVSMARTNSEIAACQYEELLRSLRLQLRMAFFTSFYLICQTQVYDTEISLLKDIIRGYEQVYPKGLISLKELVRMKALLLSLESERLDLASDLLQKQTTLKTLIADHSPHFILTLADTGKYSGFRLELWSQKSLNDTALKNRNDLRILEKQMKYAETDLAFQRLVNVPDPTLILGWDQNGSFVHNYNYIGLNFNLPFWNRNKGNILAARARITESQASYRNFLNQVMNEVNEDYKTLANIEKVYSSIDPGFGSDFSRIIFKAAESFQKHEISLLEFVDLYESYKDSRVQYLKLQNDRINAIEELFYAVGKTW